MKNKIKPIAVILVVFFLGYLVSYIKHDSDYSSALEKSSLFVEKCSELNGKDLTFNNLTSLNGYIGISENHHDGEKWTGGSFGYHPLKEDLFKRYLKGEYLDDSNPYTIKNQKLIRVGPGRRFSIADKSSVEGIWICRITPDSTNAKISSSSARYLPVLD